MTKLKYGPVGDPESRDPWEFAQARMPEGWHAEGQVLGLSRGIGYRAFATKRREGRNSLVVEAIGYTMALALANLPRRVRLFIEHGYDA
ncbi:MAG: hypothetical protein Q8P61_05485 [Candidatus Nanopelagicales bacterium]|nr:hypothetical protein [Candidatus Nanopelagicales bacterium]